MNSNCLKLWLVNTVHSLLINAAAVIGSVLKLLSSENLLPLLVPNISQLSIESTLS